MLILLILTHLLAAMIGWYIADKINYEKALEDLYK